MRRDNRESQSERHHYRETNGRRTGERTRESSRSSRSRHKKDHSLATLGAVLAVLVVAAGGLMIKSRLTGDGRMAMESEAADEVAGEVIRRDIYVDYSALAPGQEQARLDLKGMNRQQAGKALSDTYSWSMKVLNTNPNLDKFTMPNVPKKEDSSAETGADADGTVYQETVDDPLASVTISAGKDEFDVPDVIGGEIDRLLDQIYEEYRQQSTESTEAGKAKKETSSSEEAADYTLQLPDFAEQASSYGKQLALLWNDKPKNGEIVSYDKDSDKFVFGGSADGYTLNGEGIADALLTAYKQADFSAQVKAPGEVVAGSDSTTREKYKTIATFTTNTTANEVRNKNVRLACAAINGTVLQPGEEFSFNDVVGERTEAKGYGPAGAYSNGEVVQEIGGGVCQASSTLFNAVFRSGLKTTYRRSHTFEPSYVTPGCDATVSWGGPDYKFVNSSDHAVGIRASYADRTCTVSIYGVPVLEDGTSWSLESVKTQDLPLDPPKIITTGNPTKGTTGSVWVTYKIIHKDGGTEKVKDHTTKYKGHPPTQYAAASTEPASTESTEATESAADNSGQGPEQGVSEQPQGPAADTAPAQTDAPDAAKPADAPAEGPGGDAAGQADAAGAPTEAP